jgi:hypothetical protein
VRDVRELVALGSDHAPAEMPSTGVDADRDHPRRISGFSDDGKFP